MQLDGERSLSDAASAAGVDIRQLCSFAAILHEACLIEFSLVARRIATSPWRRVLNFLGDYFPSDELEASFARVQKRRVVILGTGAVGSWVAVQLAQSGLKEFTLIDPDEVEPSNLNRSLFVPDDIGRSKVEVLSECLRRIRHDVDVTAVDTEISEPVQLRAIVGEPHRQTIVVNCADSPSVDFTSALVDRACQPAAIPYVIAGGYNLHLSLIGMTVIPGKSACYQCSRIGLEELQGDDLVGLRKLHRPWRNIGSLAPLAAITASLAVSEVIRLALAGDRIQPAMLNRRGEFNFLTNEIHFTDLPPRRECGCVEELREA